MMHCAPLNINDSFLAFVLCNNLVLIAQMTQLKKGQKSKVFQSCPVPQKEVHINLMGTPIKALFFLCIN